MTMSRTGIKTLLILVVIIVAAAVVVYLVRSHAAEEAKLSSAAGTALSAADGSFTSLSGESVDVFSSESGITIAYAWASWCPQCKADLEALDTFAQAHQSDAVPVKVIAINRREPAATAERFLNQLDISDAIAIVIDSTDQYYTLINGYAMPELVVFDDDGDEILRQRGAVNMPTLTATVEWLQAEAIE